MHKLSIGLIAATLMLSSAGFAGGEPGDGRFTPDSGHSQTLRLQLGSTTDQWHEIGYFDLTGRALYAIGGSALLSPGEFIPINAGPQLQVRIRDGVIEERHREPRLNGAGAYVLISYADIPPSLAPAYREVGNIH